MRACLVPAAALGVATLALTAADAGASGTGSEVLRPALVSGWAGAASSSTLRLEVTHGVCSKGVRLTGLRMTRTAVRVRFAEVFDAADADLVCPALARVSCFAVRLPRPRRSRAVVDAGRGVRVPRSVAPSPAASGRHCRPASRG